MLIEYHEILFWGQERGNSETKIIVCAKSIMIFTAEDLCIDIEISLLLSDGNFAMANSNNLDTSQTKRRIVPDYKTHY